LQPYIEEIRKWQGRGVVVTGAAPKNSGFDFYSRFFCPNLGMNEVHIFIYASNGGIVVSYIKRKNLSQ